MPDHLARPIAIFDDPLQGAARFVQVGSSAVEPAQAGLGVGDDGAASGWFTSWAIEAASAPKVVTRVTCARSVCA